MYLDIAVLYTGRIDILDEDELLDAYDKKDITKEEYEIVLKTKEKLLKEIDASVLGFIFNQRTFIVLGWRVRCIL